VNRVLIAECENQLEPGGERCPGRLRYARGQTEAACDLCGGRCGIAVAAWVAVAVPRPPS
jgi:hypothetical protein